MLCMIYKNQVIKIKPYIGGRVPTDLGLRFFVDGLLQVGRIRNNECEEIKKH